MCQPSVKERTAEFEAENAMLEQRLASAPEPPKIRLHPNLAGLYWGKVAALEEALADPATGPDTVASIRRQIERITLTPSEEGALDVQLCGDLARIVEFCERSERKSGRPGGGGLGRGWGVVAGACNQRRFPLVSAHGLNRPP